MTEYPYQATIVGNESLPGTRTRFGFLRELAEELKPGQHVRLVVPITTKKATIRSVWYSIKGKGKPHSMFKKSHNEFYTVYLWFGPLVPSVISELLKRHD